MPLNLLKKTFRKFFTVNFIEKKIRYFFGKFEKRYFSTERKGVTGQQLFQETPTFRFVLTCITGNILYILVQKDVYQIQIEENLQAEILIFSKEANAIVTLIRTTSTSIDHATILAEDEEEEEKHLDTYKAQHFLCKNIQALRYKLFKLSDDDFKLILEYFQIFSTFTTGEDEVEEEEKNKSIDIIK